jgi:hypothetical protein
VFVPQDALGEHVRGLLPLKRDEFERRMKAAQAATPSGHSPEPARIDRAELRGRIAGEQIEAGAGEMTIAFSGSGPAMLRLAPWNLAIDKPVWRGRGEQAAVLGLADDGKVACLVERAGTLQFDWSLRGKRDERGDVVFQLQIPPAPQCHLLLEVPADRVLTVEPGIAQLQPPAEGDKTPPPEGAAAALRTWSLELGGSREVSLRVARRRGKSAAPVVLVREAINYAVQSSAIDVEAALEIDVLEQSLTQITLTADEPFQPTGIRLGSHLLDWTLSPTADGQQRLVVALPETLTGEGHVLQISGAAAWSGQRGFRLPRVRMLEGTWQEGRATLAAPVSLRLAAAPLGGCRQTGFSAGTPARQADQFQFQMFLVDAGLSISPSAAPATLIEASGTHLQFDASQVLGTCVAELSAASGERFEIEAIVPQRWIVDAVEVQPADFLEDRSVTPRGPGLQTLRLSLRRPLAEGRTLRVVTRAHCRRAPAGAKLPDDFLRLVEFQDLRQARRLVSLRNLDPGVLLRLAADEGLVRLDPLALSSDQSRLFESTAGPILFERRPTQTGPDVLVEPTTSQFQVEATVQAFVERSQTRERIRLRCQPEESAIGQVQVRLSPAPSAIEWQLVGEEGRGLAARRLEAADEELDEAVYELTLAQPRAGTFEIAGELTLPAGGSAQVVLASLPGAVSQTGTIEVHAEGGRPVTISGEGYRPLPPPVQTPGTFGTLRGLFAYDPGERATLRVVTHEPGSGQSLAWVESVVLTSRFSSDGSGDHEAVFRLVNSGQSELLCELPKEAIGVRAAIDGQPGSLLLQRPAAGMYAAPLPAGQRQVTLRLQYASDPPAATWLPCRQFAAPVPQVNLPVLASQWRVDLAPNLLPQRRAEHASEPQSRPTPASDDFLAAGWSRHELALPAASFAPLAVFRPSMIRAWAWCLGLAAAAVSYRLLPRWPGILILLAGAAIATAVVASPVIAPLAAGLAIGIGCGAAGLLLRPRYHGRSRFAASPQGSTVVVNGAAAGAIVVLIALALATSAVGAPPDAARAGDPAPARVVFPVDDRGEPAGDYVFLEPALYDALLKLTGRGKATPEDWLVCSAQYRLAGSPREDGPRRSIDEIVAQFDIETFQPSVVIPLAFQRTQIHLLEGRTLVDGRPVKVEWGTEGQPLYVPIEAPGRHRLELAFGAAAGVVKDGVLLDLEIPRIAASQVIVAAGSAEPVIDSALGAKAPVAAGEDARWRLGPASRLTARWPATGAPNEAVRVEADQLVLWKILPGSVVAETIIKARPVGGQLSELALQVDPRLRLLPLAASEPVAAYSLDEEGAAATLRLALRQPATAETTLKLSFLWVGSSGIGNLVPPPIAISADDVTRSWTCLSLAPGLEWETAPEARQGDPSLAEFAAAWGDSPGERAIAFDEKRRELPALAVRPAVGRVRAVQAIDCSFSARSIVVKFQADLSGVPADAFQHRLTIAPQCKARQLVVQSGGRPLAARWTQEPDNSLAITLAQPPGPNLRLELTGELMLPANASRVATPLVRYVGAQQSTYAVRVYRQPDVLVAVQAQPAAWKAADEGAGEFRQDLGRLVKTLDEVEGRGANPPQVTLSANQPQTTGSLVVRVERGPTAWLAVADLVLDVQKGQLDALRIATPPSWTGPLDIVPAVEQQLALVPGEVGRQLVIRPQRAVSGALKLTIRGPLRSTGGELVAAPELKLIDLPQVERLVALPDRLGSQRLDWETSGLQATAEAPALPAGVIPPGFDLFQTVAPKFSAVARLRDRSGGAPTVRLADHEVALTSGGSLVAHSRLDLAPNGARQVTLELPPGQQLVDVSVEGLPAQLSRIGSRRWTIALVADRLPQRIEVVTRGTLPAGSGANVALAAPRLAEASAERSLWTLRGGLAAAAEAGSATPQRLEVARLAAIAAALETLADLPAADLPPAAVANSWAAWQRRFDAVRAALPAGESLGISGLAGRVRAAEADAAAVRNQLLSTGILTSDSAPTAPASGTNQPTVPAARISCYEFAGSAGALSVALTGVKADDRDNRLAWAGLAMAASVLVWRLATVRRLRNWLVEYAPLALALAGLGWVWLGPLGWIGWIAVALAVWLALRSPWPKRSGEPLSGIVRRSTLSR